MGRPRPWSLLGYLRVNSTKTCALIDNFTKKLFLHSQWLWWFVTFRDTPSLNPWPPEKLTYLNKYPTITAHQLITPNIRADKTLHFLITNPRLTFTVVYHLLPHSHLSAKENFTLGNYSNYSPLGNYLIQTSAAIYGVVPSPQLIPVH